MKGPKKLLFSVTRKDLEVTFYSGHGPGGTNRNKHQNCVRIKHPDSGALVTAQECRERPANIKAAMQRLVEHPKFKLWWSKKCWEIEKGETVDQAVEEAMDPANLRVESRSKDGKWVPYVEDGDAVE